MYVKDNVVKEIDVFSGEQKTIQYLSYDSVGATKQIILFSGEQKTLDATFVQKSSNDVSATIALSDSAIVLGTSIVSITNSSKENKTWSNDLTIATSLSAMSSNLGTLSINLKTSASVGGNVKTVNPNNVIKESDLTDEERNNISSKLLDKIVSSLPDDLVGELPSTPEDVY
jgi:uncharacterized membrane protein